MKIKLDLLNISLDFDSMNSSEDIESCDKLVCLHEENIKQLQTRIYIFKVLGLVSELKNIVENSKEVYSESTIKITKVYDIDIGWFLRTGVRLSDRYEYHNPTSEVLKIFNRLENIKYFNKELSSDKLEDYKEYIFTFSEYDKIRSLLLSSEILNFLDYKLLQLDLKQKEEDYNRLIKV